MAKNRKTYDDDDGRTVADMDVDGMPLSLSGTLRAMGKKQPRTESSKDFSDLTKAETFQIVKGAVLAGLLIAGVFIVGCLLFILFWIFVWFR